MMFAAKVSPTAAANTSNRRGRGSAGKKRTSPQSVAISSRPEHSMPILSIVHSSWYGTPTTRRSPGLAELTLVWMPSAQDRELTVPAVAWRNKVSPGRNSRSKTTKRSAKPAAPATK